MRVAQIKYIRKGNESRVSKSNCSGGYRQRLDARFRRSLLHFIPAVSVV